MRPPKPRTTKGSGRTKTYSGKNEKSRDFSGKPFSRKKSYDDSGRDSRPERFGRGRGNEERPYFKKERSGGDEERPYFKKERSGSGGAYGDKPFSRKKSYDDAGRDSRPERFGRGRGDEERPYFKKERGGGDEERPYFKKERGGGDEERPYFKKERSGDGGYRDRPASRFYDDEGDREELNMRSEMGSRKRGEGKKRPEERFERATNPAKTKGKVTFHQTAYTSMKALFEAHPDGVRLNKYVAHSGLCSRRKADEIIEAGQISINDEVVREMGHKVQAGDVVKYKDSIVEPVQKVYILLNKPKDYITTTDDPQGRRTVMDLVGGASEERLYPVGRLDRNTTGLLLLTNDGELAQKLSHPSSEMRKSYLVQLDKPLTKADFKRIEEGIELEDGMAVVDELSYTDESDKAEIFIELHIGRNRIVRRIFEHLGYEIEKLDRIIYADLTKKDLPRGRWRYLTDNEIQWLKYSKKKRGKEMNFKD